MCGSSPKAPEPLPPPQEVKQPETAAVKESARRNRSGVIGAPSLLTGPTGVTGALTTGKATLLGQ